MKRKLFVLLLVFAFFNATPWVHSQTTSVELESIGSWPGYAWGIPQDIVVQGNTAFVAAGPGGIQIIDVSNPASPFGVSGLFPVGWTSGLDVAGHRLFTAYPGGMGIVDVFDREHPVEIGRLDSIGEAQNIRVVGNLALVAAGVEGLRIIDVSQPWKTILISTLDTTGFTRGLDVVGDLAFLADEQGGLKIVEFSQPGNPLLIGESQTPGQSLNVDVAGHLAYVAEHYGGLSIIDISEPSSPLPLGRYEAEDSIQDVIVNGSLALLAAGDSGLIILEVSDPSNPTWLGSLPTIGYAKDIHLDGDLVYVSSTSEPPYYFFFDRNFNGLDIISIDDPATPVLVGRVTGRDAAYEVLVDEQRQLAFLISEAREGDLFGRDDILDVIDISHPIKPAHISTLPIRGPVRKGRLKGHLLFLASDRAGMQIVNTQDPTNPILIASYRPSIFPRSLAVMDIAVTEDHALLATSRGLLSVEVSDPENPSPVELSELFPGSFNAIEATENLAFLAAGSDGFQVIDVESLLSPPMLSREAVLQVIPDTSPPFLVSADSQDTRTTITVRFNEAIDSITATDTFLYEISGGGLPAPTGPTLSIKDPDDVFGRTVILTVAGLEWNTRYTLKVVGVEDALGQAIDFAQGSSIDFCTAGATCEVTGLLSAPTLDQPFRLERPLDLLLEEGEFGSLRISAEGLVYQWEEKLITGWQPIQFALGPTLEIGPVGPNDQGRRFRVQARAKPSLVGEVSSMSDARDIQLVGDMAFVADLTQGLQLFNVQDPSTPTMVTHLEVPDQLHRIRVANDKAYLTASSMTSAVSDAVSWRIDMIGLEDLTNPSVLASWAMRSTYPTGIRHHMDIFGSFIAVADGNWGLTMLELVSNRAPVGLIDISKMVELGPSLENGAVVAMNNRDECVTLSAHDSYDPDGHEIVSYMWLVDGLPVGEGPEIDMCLPVGTTEVTLLLDDGQESRNESATVLTVEVITICEAMEELILMIDESPLPHSKKRPLIDTLKTSCALAEQNRNDPVVHLLQMILLIKIEQKLAQHAPTLAIEWTGYTQQVINTFHRVVACVASCEDWTKNPER